jgi:hypothetical protein
MPFTDGISQSTVPAADESKAANSMMEVFQETFGAGHDYNSDDEFDDFEPFE